MQYQDTAMRQKIIYRKLTTYPSKRKKTKPTAHTRNIKSIGETHCKIELD